MADAGQRRILYAEDDAFFRQFLLRKLQAANFEVVVAADGAEVLAELQKNPSFDLILLDLMMPKMNGFDVLERMHADEKLRAIPVIVLSSMESESDRNKVAALGAKQFLVKDLASNDILDAVKRTLPAAA